MTALFHPRPEDITLTALLAALGDPVRLAIVRNLNCCEDGKNCGAAAPFPDISRSTLSGHFRVLRASGLVWTTRRGVEYINRLRREDIDARFPGLLDTILAL
ncbi:ArsR/SmtB family transcription factor [Rhodoblastus sp.]|uniref:ArsR/SmtB family transcription factor n=1 Tax=Rhodoblastus sp. TaxID=1962975 RepID=UPI0035AF3C59